MTLPLKAVAFDVDDRTLASLREAFPGWEIVATQDASVSSLKKDWDPGATDLLVVEARHPIGETLGLCRSLRSQLGRAHTPLVVLTPQANEALMSSALDAGATVCLTLPVAARDLIGVLSYLRENNRPGRPNVGARRTQPGDQSRDDGGEA